MRYLPGARGGDEGFTLIELLIAMIVIAIGVFAVVGALRLGIVSGEGQRTMSTGELTLRSFAEHVKAEVYQPCAGPGDYGTLFDVADPDGLLWEVSEILYWDGATVGPVTFTETCPEDDFGLQQLLVAVEAETAGAVHRTLVVKRAP